MRHLLAAAAAIVCAGPAAAAPVFILNDTGGVGAGTQARAGFEAAAALWAAVFADDVTIRLDVGFRALGSGILGQAGSARSDVSYDRVRDALDADATSALDAQTAAGLRVIPDLRFVSNEAGNCATGVGCRPISVSHRSIDRDGTRDNRYLAVNTATQQALGVRGDTGARDAQITFSSSFDWDWDASNGVSAGFYDFVGVAAHEIGHALGFVSGVDLVDGNVGETGLDTIAWGTVLDLFRFDEPRNLRDWRVGGSPCVSLDRGGSCLGALSTGARYGDGRQASHWKDNLGLGIMDPTAAPGEALRITARDRAAYDVIGWDLAGAGAGGSVAWADAAFWSDPGVFWDVETIGPGDFGVGVPAPGAVALLGLGAFALTRRRRVATRALRAA